jgi:2'-5' RNA ligase
MRLFTAITLPSKVKRALASTTNRLKKEIDYGKFSDSSNYHITLVFMGDIDESKLPTIHKIMDDTASNFPPLCLSAEDIGYFEKRNRKILYYNVSGHLNALSKMQHYLYQNIHAEGLCRAENSYTPHITFARNVKCDNIFEVENSLPFMTGEITLMHSTRVNDRLCYLPIYLSLIHI